MPDKDTFIELVKSGYTFKGESFAIGGAMLGGEVLTGTIVNLPLKTMNRHGLIAGATGTGKTVTIQAMCERFSEIGTPVFVADVKGDLAGLSQPGGGNEKVDQRLAEMAIPDYTPRGYPVVFWDIYGVQGHQVRTTISEMGPILLARLMQLNDTQAGVLQIVFAWADAQHYPLIDFRDLRALLGEVADQRADILKDYGTVSAQSVGAIQRAVLTMEQQGVDKFFGEPALDLADLMLRTPAGAGAINVLVADRLSALEQWDLSEADAIQNELRRGMVAIEAGETRAGAQRFADGVGRGGSFAG